MKLISRVLSFVLVCVLCTLAFPMPNVRAEGAFETNLTGWTTGDGAEWVLTEAGYMCTDKNGKHLAKADLVIDPNKSFEYEVSFNCIGYGAGMAFSVIDIENFTAIEINKHGHVYFPYLLEGTWSTFYAYGEPLSEEEIAITSHTIKLVYNAPDESAEVFVDGILRSELVDFDTVMLEGNIGLYFEGAEVVYTKAIYTPIETPTKAPSTPKSTASASPKAEATVKPTQAVKATAAKEVADDSENSNVTVLIVIACVLAAGIVVAIILVLRNNRKK